MKELQKYYYAHTDCFSSEPKQDIDYEPGNIVYLASEADAHIADLKSQHAEECARLSDAVLSADADLARVAAENERLREVAGKYALNIDRLEADKERLKRRDESMMKLCLSKIESVESIHQRFSEADVNAERYQKLRRFSDGQIGVFIQLGKGSPESFDEQVDQLPASGQSAPPKTLLDFGYAPGGYISTCLAIQTRRRGSIARATSGWRRCGDARIRRANHPSRCERAHWAGAAADPGGPASVEFAAVRYLPGGHGDRGPGVWVRGGGETGGGERQMSNAFWRAVTRELGWPVAWPLCWLAFWVGHFVSLAINAMPDTDAWERPAAILYPAYHWLMMVSVRLQDRFELPAAPWRDA